MTEIDKKNLKIIFILHLELLIAWGFLLYLHNLLFWD